MTRPRIMLIVVWVLSLILVGALAHAQSSAQRGNTQPPIIISGSDLGFRVARQQGNRVAGTLVVRINGEWLDAEPAAGAKALSLK
jgi:uncharacterized membrane protein